MLRIAPIAALCCAVSPLFWSTPAARAEDKPARKTPIILDTDIGGDIDDALALGLVLTSPELELRGVTTVYGDAYTRALIVCRLLDVLERGKIPVAAGAPPRQVPDFTGQMQYGLRPAHKRPVKESAVEFLAAQLKAAPGELTIVCIGPLTNIAGLLEKHPEAAKQIKRLVIMGGSIRTGYKGKPAPDAEWNVFADRKAAQKVLGSGVPTTLVPLDVTAALQLTWRDMSRLFGSPPSLLARHLEALYQLSDEQRPVLFDPTAVAACIDESLFGFADRRIEIDDEAITRLIDGPPNVRAAETVRREALFELFLDRVTKTVIEAKDLTADVVVDVGKDGRFYLRGNRLDPWPLFDLLTAASQQKPALESLTFNAHPLAASGWKPRAKSLTDPLMIPTVKLSERPVRPAFNYEKVASPKGFPRRVHVAENYETNIERRWWLAGTVETEHVPRSSMRACRAVLTNDFDDLQGDKYAIYKAVIFNPVPGPPMGKRTRLAFRYHLTGADSLRVQIYTLTKGYHRQLTVKGLEQGRWAEATVDMTQARRPDGSGGPLSEDERIDDIQFYIDPAAELVIDDIVLYDAAQEDTSKKPTGGEGGKTKGGTTKQPFPKQIVFTAWFDTGKQGAEWPGDFEIVPHKPPLTWKAAKAVAAPDGKSQWVRLDLRGPRPLPAQSRLRFHYLLRGAKSIGIELGAEGAERRGTTTLPEAKEGAWSEADVDLRPAVRSLAAGRKAGRGETMAATARDVVFRAAIGTELLVDDVLLYEPGSDRPAASEPGDK